MSQPLVSLITPTYNRRLFMPQAIRNFMSQVYPKNKIEWIIADDGEDKIYDLVKDIPEVRYYSLDTKMKLGKKRNFLNIIGKVTSMALRMPLYCLIKVVKANHKRWHIIKKRQKKLINL